MPNPRWYPNYCGWSRANPPVSSELSSSESITSSSKLSSSATFTTCSCPTEDGGCTDCVYTLFRNKKERKRDEINSMLRRKKLSKKRNPFEMSSKTLKKLESKKRNKKLLEDTFSDSSDDSDCNCYHPRCNCNQYSSKNKQKNSKNKREENERGKCEKKMSSKRTGKCTKNVRKTATTSEPLKYAKKKISATKSSGKEKTSVFNPCNSRGRNCATKCAGSSKCSRVSTKFTKNAKSNKKVSCKCTTGSSERYSSSFSSEDFEDESSSITSDDSEYESFSDDEDPRDHCCGNVRQSCRKTKR